MSQNKKSKTYCILKIYQMLVNGEEFSFTYLMNEFNCSKRTCVRYIREVKAFIKDNLHKKVHYSRKNDSFILED